ncbi:MAG TPA: transcription-repair coupling factor [Verrucomicrobiae bacterium]|nr:transcription-repair coupling factor [Verrucomicrobiae bacterium]
MARTPAGRALRRRLEKGGVLSCHALNAAGQPFFAAFVHYLFPYRPLLVVTEGLRTQELFHQDLLTWGGQGNPAGSPVSSAVAPASAHFYPAWETLPQDAKLPHADVISERLETLVALSEWTSTSRTPAAASQPAPRVVASVTSLMQRTFRPEQIRERTRTLRRGDNLDPLDLVEWLEDQGYEPEAKVNHKGEVALRGGIVDVFPLTQPWPVRLEFFGNELESLRAFDPISQVSREPLETVVIPPGGELGILKRMVRPATDPGRPGAWDGFATLLDYLPAEALVLLCQPEALAEHAASYAELVPAADPFFVSWAELQGGLIEGGRTVVSVAEGPASLTSAPADAPAADADWDGLRFDSLEAFRPLFERGVDPQVAETQRRAFFAQLHRWVRQGYAVRVFCNNGGERQRFEEVWEDYGLAESSGGSDALPAAADEAGAEVAQRARPSPRLFPIWIGSLSRGFLCEEARLVVATDAEIFGRYKVQRPRRLKSPHAQTSRSLLEIDFTDLEEGDYVVHLQHGIGRYLGLQLLPVASGSRRLEKAATARGPEARQECLVIEYAQADPEQPAPRLYVPLGEAHLVSKYVGAGKARPPLNTLGGGRWQKTKEQAEHAVQDLAAELLSIQAARDSQPGHACQPDTPWQREFEGAFLYEETPDQWKAILATKNDMEASKPMDRLICGDVGYGKTEVAIRAAFKAVMEGLQVAILVPTTVLAQQHFNTFRERMADYPIRIELLSRFRTPREQKKVIQDLAAGSVDIVIGTHRLIQDDIAFKDLGLVVIDEEQRFGVLHKEKFKLLRRLVDVLTLSATPIPRTLYLALTGARDMSTIETPPQDRLPVETIVTECDERVIRDAILRELNRGGQVFYLHNRVLDINAVALRLRALVPKARLLVGHGQMHADELEEVMTKFVNGEADVLLSTTIIESGIDIPNANTIIIDRADRFGLSDLYQLRGRVGRYKHQAYAYLLVPRHARLLTDARKRMSAIKQYSTLGSGFKIAMRDLEIRGAGNLLGPQQSGHITAVGFELYCQLLKQSVARLKGEQVKPRIDVITRIDFLRLHQESDPSAPATGADVPAETRLAQSTKPGAPDFQVSVPRDVAVYSESRRGDETPPAPPARAHGQPASAGIPLAYVPDPRQRIEVYRKLAEVMDEEGLNRLKAELRDRFGPLPAPVELLLQLAAVRLAAAERGITAIETQDEKLMLTRRNDFIMVGGKFPRLTKKEPRARLNEIKRLLQMLK